MKEKKIIPLNAGDLDFLITRAGWLFTHVCEHFNCEQSKFKKDFIIMNQKSKQKATSFVKLPNDSNFEIILELTVEITLTTVFCNLFTMTSLKYLTLKSS